MTVLAAEAAPAAAGAGGGGAAAGGFAAGGLPVMGQGQGQGQGSSVAFAIAVLLLGFACIGLWLAFHKPENAETGGFPGLFGQMLQWVHAGETSEGAAAAASQSSSGASGIPGLGIIGGIAGDVPEGGLFSLLPSALQKKIVDVGAGTGLVQWLKEHI